MTNLLSWKEPKQAMNKTAWSGISADGAPPGVYTPNMSDEDKLKWKAKKISGKDPRIEVRKTSEFEQRAQVVMILRPNGQLTFSANGKAVFDSEELVGVIAEMQKALEVE